MFETGGVSWMVQLLNTVKKMGTRIPVIHVCVELWFASM